MGNPQAPQSMIGPAPGSAPGAPPARRLPASYGASWWAEGWRIFAAAPLPWLGIVVILLALMFLLFLLPVVGSIAQTLLMPVFGGGVMLGCHALARGEPLRISHLFDGFGSGRFGPLVILGLVMLAAGFVVGLLILAVAFVTIGIGGLTALVALGDSPPLDLTSLSTLASFGVGLFLMLVIGLVGGSLIAMAYWFAPALVVLHGEDPVNALRRSFKASWRNLGAMLIYGLIYAGLAILASILLGLGWFVLAPMIAGSCYAGWRTIFA